MSAWRIENNLLRIVKIQHIKSENSNVKTITFKDKLCSSAKPGQFIMVWIPGVDEIPLSVSATHPNGSASITVAEVGEATKALNNMAVGDLIGIRGPFGNSFKIFGKRVLIVGGGTGMAPLMLLINRIADSNIEVEVTIIEGAETRNKLIFLDELADLNRVYRGRINVFFATEDGSYGVKGLVTDLAEKLLRKEDFDIIYTCGPEKMIRKVYELSKQYSVDIQASLERYMRCAMGICGSCLIGQYRVCKDGPVFNKTQLMNVEEYLGRIKYNEMGEKTRI